MRLVHRLAHLHRLAHGLAFATSFCIGAALTSAAVAQNDAGGAIELVDPNVLRVCADPRSLPFSNEAGEGFENKLATLVAQKLGKSLSYTYYPNTTGFVRNTLAAFRCDVIMGMPQGDDIVQGTNPYYRTSYVLVFKPDAGLDSLETLEDPRLKDKRLGIIAGTPPATNLAVNGLLIKTKSYPLVIDSRYDAPTTAMMDDLRNGSIDVAILWGPIAGYLVKQSKLPLKVVPLLKETSGPKMIYRMGMGVRHSDQEWKRRLNKIIADNQGEITSLLIDYGVPLLDEDDRPLTH